MDLWRSGDQFVWIMPQDAKVALLDDARAVPRPSRRGRPVSGDRFTEHYRLLSTDPDMRRRAARRSEGGARRVLRRDRSTATTASRSSSNARTRSPRWCRLPRRSPAPIPAARLAEVSGRIYDMLHTTGIGGYLDPERAAHLGASRHARALGPSFRRKRRTRRARHGPLRRQEPSPTIGGPDYDSSMVETRTGAELVQDFIATFGIEYVFGNPGTTETTFLAALAGSSATYVLALNEPSAVGIAAGYSLATGKTAMVSLHTYPGLASGMFNLRNAYLSGVPLFVVNGTEDSRFLVHNPVLGGPNTQLAETATKYQYEVRNIDELTVAMQRCWVQAGLQPTRPVFLSVPMDFMQGSTKRITFKPTQILDDTASTSIAQVAEALRAAGKLAIVVDYAVGWDRSVPAMTNLAGRARGRHLRRAVPRAGRVRHAAPDLQGRAATFHEGGPRDPVGLRHRAAARREARHLHLHGRPIGAARAADDPDHPRDRAARLRLAGRHRRRRRHPRQPRWPRRARSASTPKRRSPRPTSLRTSMRSGRPTRRPAATRQTE